MLKFARNRSSSAERSRPVSKRELLVKTNTRDFSPARRIPSQETPKRSSSLERQLTRTRRQLAFFEGDDPTPRAIAAQRQFVPKLPAKYSHPLSPPPIVRRAKASRIPISTPSPEGSDTSDYKELSSGTFCRAPMTPTLERLSTVGNGVAVPHQPKSALKNQSKYDFHRAIEKLVEKLDLQMLDTSSESGYGSDDHDSLKNNPATVNATSPPPLPRRKSKSSRRVHFDSYVLLLQGIRERNLELVQHHVTEVCQEALATDEVMMEFMKSVIENESLIVNELLAHGSDPNYVDPTGLTALHLAATFNNLDMIKTLLSAGAAIHSRAHCTGKTPSEMCSVRLPGYQACHAYLRCMEECLGVANSGRVFVCRPYRTCRNDELCVDMTECLVVRKRGDYDGSSWWWCVNSRGEEGYVLKDLLALHRPSES